MNKPLTRRLFGKALATAPMAATHAATLGASPAGAGMMNKLAPPMPTYSYSGGLDMAQTSDKALDLAEHYRQRRAHLESVIAGKEPSTNSGEPFNGNSAFVDLHYSSLQSLSPAGRMILAHREMERRSRANQVHWAKRELDSILSNWKW